MEPTPPSASSSDPSVQCNFNPNTSTEEVPPSAKQHAPQTIHDQVNLDQANGTDELLDATCISSEDHQKGTVNVRVITSTRVSASVVPDATLSAGNSNDASISAVQKTCPANLVPPTQLDASEKAADVWIDRTNESLGAIGNGYTLSSNLTCLNLTNNRLKTIENLEPCTLLRELVLSQNSISTVQGLDTLMDLVELDLYMNHIGHIPPTSFQNNPKLKKLDLSFNRIRILDAFPCNNLSRLHELYLIGNKIKQITGLHGMPNLVMLELGDNRIRVIENLQELITLEGLWLGRNKLTKMQNLDPLLNLRRLGLQSNRIETIEGLSHLVNLEELYLSNNGISSMDGIQSLVNLQVLDLAVNFIKNITNIENLTLLKEFWINGNLLQSIEELHLLQNASNLETVYLEGNPLAQDANYQRRALDILPDSLSQLDAVMVEEVRKQFVDTNQSRTSPDVANI